MGVQHSEIEYSPPEITDTAPGRRKRFFCNHFFDSPPLEPDTRLFTYFESSVVPPNPGPMRNNANLLHHAHSV